MFVLWLWTFIAVAQSAPEELYEGDEPGECSDGADNDRDGLFDCDDSQCAGAPVCRDPAPGADAPASPPEVSDASRCRDGSGKSCAAAAQMAFDEGRLEEALALSSRGCELGNGKSCKLAANIESPPEVGDDESAGPKAEASAEFDGLVVRFHSEKAFYLQCGTGSMRKHRPSGDALATAERRLDHPTSCTFTQSGLNQKIWIAQSGDYSCSVQEGSIKCSAKTTVSSVIVTETDVEIDVESNEEDEEECADGSGADCDEVEPVDSSGAGWLME